MLRVTGAAIFQRKKPASQDSRFCLNNFVTLCNEIDHSRSMASMLRQTLLAAIATAAIACGARMQLTPLMTTAGDPYSDLYRTTGRSGYDGVALLAIESPEGLRGCTGALLSSGLHVLTAAHCLTDSAGAPHVFSLAATFYASDGAAEVISASSFLPHPAFNGALEQGSDIGIILLDHAPSPSVQRYAIYTGSEEIGSTYEVAGFGASGSGDTGYIVDDWERRRGWNTFDATITTTFGGFPGWTAGDGVLVSDFDSGFAENDALGRFYGIPGLGLGAGEVSMAPGDSGAPAFIDGRIAGIASFRLRLSFTDGTSSDIDEVANASFGEFNAFTRVSSYQTWIQPVPEPATMALCAAVFALAGVRWLLRRSTEERS
jgi:secreted trypsin-like serine protease